MKLFISTESYDPNSTFFRKTYVVADKINTVGVEGDALYSLAGALDSGSRSFHINLGSPARDSRAEADRALLGLCELIGKHSTPEPGSVMIGFNGRQWVYF